MQALVVVLFLLSERQFYDEGIPGLRYEDQEKPPIHEFLDDDLDWFNNYDTIFLQTYDCDIEDCETV
jgi:hypothetical protein